MASTTRRRPRRPQQQYEPDVDVHVDPAELSPVEGILDVKADGYGFLRVDGYAAGPADVYVARSQIQRLGLRPGDLVAGQARRPKQSESRGALVHVDEAPDPSRPAFDRLPAPSPDERLSLEHDRAEAVSRIVDLVSPIGKGQRGLVVAPPRAGKTTVLRRIAQAVTANNPEVEVLVLLVDERPEEAYHWRESLGEGATVVASTFDRPIADHVQTAELVLERAKRRVEAGADVLILLDSLTRLARTYNLAAPSGGRMMSGGMEQGALDPPKRFFGAARNVKDGGSLTILASCLLDTGNRMDEVIFEEFKGRGNMELRLDRSLAEKRLYPAVNVAQSGTRNDELLLDQDELTASWRLRRALNAVDAEQAIGILLQNVGQTATNAEFLARVARV